MNRCSVDGCDKFPITGDLCKTHYERYRHGRDVHAPIREYKKRSDVIKHQQEEHEMKIAHTQVFMGDKGDCYL